MLTAEQRIAAIHVAIGVLTLLAV